MADACERLEAVRERKEIYTEADIPGLGKNYLTEKHRSRAAAAYRFFIRYHALRDLCGHARAALETGSVDAFRRTRHLGSMVANSEEHRPARRGEAGPPDLAAVLAELTWMARKVAAEVRRSKAKDDERGRQIIADYADAHRSIDEDPVIQQATAEAERLVREVDEIVAHYTGVPATAFETRLSGAPAPVG
jgi:hypothetical protein